MLNKRQFSWSKNLACSGPKLGTKNHSFVQATIGLYKLDKVGKSASYVKIEDEDISLSFDKTNKRWMFLEESSGINFMQLKTDQIQFIPTETVDSDIYVDQNGCKKSFGGHLTIEPIPHCAGDYLTDLIIKKYKKELSHADKTITKVKFKIASYVTFRQLIIFSMKK